MILLSAHYDSYFSGFQDDNTAVAMMFGIAKALIDSGYRPKKTIVIAALAAEEWGIVNTKYDWSTGAYQQVFQVRPVDPAAYPEGLEVHAPIQTMSDDFSMAIAGIPSMVNEFTDSSFMETHYHSQFDNESYYHEPVYRFHHLLYGTLIRKFDQLILPPMDFSALFEAMNRSIDLRYAGLVGELGAELDAVTKEAAALGHTVYRWIASVNASGVTQAPEFTSSGDSTGRILSSSHSRRYGRTSRISRMPSAASRRAMPAVPSMPSTRSTTTATPSSSMRRYLTTSPTMSSASRRSASSGEPGVSYIMRTCTSWCRS